MKTHHLLEAIGFVEEQFLREAEEQIVVSAAPEAQLRAVINPQGCSLRRPAYRPVALQEGMEGILPLRVDARVAESVAVVMVRHRDGGKARLQVSFHQLLRRQSSAGTDDGGMQMGLDLVACHRHRSLPFFSV